MDRDKAEELWGKGTANANRMQANELGFEELANYLSKDPRGKKRWSQSKNIVIPVPDINDYKYSNKKLYELSQNQGEREVFEKLYPGFIYTGHDVVFNDVDGGIYVYIKMRKIENYKYNYKTIISMNICIIYMSFLYKLIKDKKNLWKYYTENVNII